MADGRMFLPVDECFQYSGILMPPENIDGCISGKSMLDMLSAQIILGMCGIFRINSCSAIFRSKRDGKGYLLDICFGYMSGGCRSITEVDQLQPIGYPMNEIIFIEVVSLLLEEYLPSWQYHVCKFEVQKVMTS